MSAGKIGYSGEPLPALLEGIEPIFGNWPVLSLDDIRRALIAFLIQKWEKKYEPTGFHLEFIGHQSHVSLASRYLQIEQTAFLSVPTCGNLCRPIRSSYRLVSVGSTGDEKH
ncbi:MAG: hypothetical protein KF722_06125 [Nitrospira sp.]|nr:hypothetical protein [Nitrospira sp.]